MVGYAGQMQSIYLPRQIITSMNRQRSNSRSSQNSGRDNNGGNDFFTPSKRLFVGGISPDAKDDELRELFSSVGPLRDFYLKRVEDRNSFLFVEYDSQEDADKALEQCNGARIADKSIFVKYAKPKTDKKEGFGDKGGNQGKWNNRGGDKFGGGNRGGDKFGGGNRGGDNRGGERFGNGPREEKGDRWNKGENQRGGFGKQERSEGNRGFGGQERERKPFGNGGNNFGASKVEQRAPVADTTDFDY